MEQGDDTTAIDAFAQSLVKPFLLKHKSKNVRLLVACCLADVLRVYAPEAPYDVDELERVFSLFVEQLRGLENPDTPNFKRHFRLLEVLAAVKTFILCQELEEPGAAIITDLFTLFFDIVSADHSQKVVRYMLDMMVSVLEEPDFPVSQELLDVILGSLLKFEAPSAAAAAASAAANPKLRAGTKAVSSTGGTHLGSAAVSDEDRRPLPANTLGRRLLQDATDALTIHITTFFKRLLQLGQKSDTELAEHVFELIYQLNAHAPGTLYRVLPMLEEQLMVEDNDERLHVVRQLIRLFHQPDSLVAVEQPRLWAAFLKRFTDKMPAIRAEIAANTKYTLVYHPALAASAAAELATRCLVSGEGGRTDGEQRVYLRGVVCVCVCVGRGGGGGAIFMGARNRTNTL